MILPLARRALAGAAVVAGVVALTFVLLRLAPGDPVEQLVGPAATPEQAALQRHALGLDRPLPVQFAAWLGRFARGDWGRSIVTGRGVRGLLADAVPATLELAGLSLVLTYVLGLAVGAVQASVGPRLDAALSVATVTLFALPGYWLGLALIIVFTYWGRALPAVFSGAVFVEAVFAWPGVGRRLVEAVQARDYPVVMGATVVSAALVVAGNFLADVATAWIDPRVRQARRDT